MRGYVSENKSLIVLGVSVSIVARRDIFVVRTFSVRHARFSSGSPLPGNYGAKNFANEEISRAETLQRFQRLPHFHDFI